MQIHFATRLQKLAKLGSIALPIVAIDAITKVIAKKNLPPHLSFDYLGGILRIQYIENTGAFLSLGAGLSDHTRFILFSVLTGIFLLGAILYLLLSSVSRFQFVSFALLVGGGIGNLIDRITIGAVPDFLNVGIGDLRTGIFNFADMAITLGSILLLLDAFQWPAKKEPQNKSN